MKRIIVAAFFLMLVYCSCGNQDAYYNQQLNRPVYDEITVNGYNVKTGIPTIQVTDSEVTSLVCGFTLIAANRKNDSILCTFTGFPAGITDSVASSGVLRLPNQWTSFINVNTDTGVYTIDMYVNGPDGNIKYPINLHVVHKFVSSGLDTEYYGNDLEYSTAGNFQSIYSASISTAQFNAHQIWIYDLSGDYYVYANLTGNYPNYSIIIPSQTPVGTTSGPTTIYGRGFSAPDTSANANSKPMIMLNDTIIVSGVMQKWVTNLKAHQ